MIKLLFSLAFLLCISTVHGTSCYQCQSSNTGVNPTNSGWDECTANQTVKNCPVEKDRCGVGIVTDHRDNLLNNVHNYVKYCASSSECKSFETSRECNKVREQTEYRVSCQGVCCSGDNCNGGNRPPVQTVQLTCESCPPSTVWSDCFVKQESMTCAFGNDRCGSASLDIKGSTIYTKGCVSHSECGGGVDCCAGNFCNHGTPAPSTIPPVHTSVLPSSCPGPVVSAIMVLACSIVAFVR
ncbi:uncharacterized protein LOC144644917 isoform X3 [Oculina patagonica]